MSSTGNRLGVVGWPVAHSRSPAIQNAALAASGLAADWHYQLLPVPAELFDETVRALPASGFRGVNVTIPHKHAALEIATCSSDRAQAIGAANTLIFESGDEIRADNTDAPALIASLTAALGGSPAGARTLVLGAGGTARAAIWALNDVGAGVSVWNRTPARAEAITAAVGGTVLRNVVGLGPIDVVINCTSVGLEPDDSLSDLPDILEVIASARVVVDFVYTDTCTPVLKAAAAAGVPTVSGLELLVGQGALSFEIFTGRSAPLSVMRAAVGLSSAP